MMITEQFSPLAGGQWRKEIPSPTSPFTMSFPNNAFDEVAGFFGDFQDDRNTNFDNPYTDPLTYSDLLSPNDGGPAGPVNVWTDSELQESEQFLTGMNAMDGNVDESRNGNNIEAIVSGPSQKDILNNQRTAPDASANQSQEPAAIQVIDTKSAELDKDTINDSLQITLDEQNGQPAISQSDSSPLNPSLSQEGGHNMNDGAYDLSSWEAIDTSVQEHSNPHGKSGHKVYYRSGSLPPAGRSGHNFSNTDSDPLDFSGWNALNDTAHEPTELDGLDRQNVMLAPVSIQSGVVVGHQDTNQSVRKMSNEEVGEMADQLPTNDQRDHHSSPAAQRPNSRTAAHGQQFDEAMFLGGVTSDDDYAHSLASSELSSNMSRPSFQRTRRYSSPASSRQHFRQGSPPIFLQRQQQQHRRAGSSLRHEIMPGQSEALLHNCPSGLYEGHGDALSIPSSIRASSSIQFQRQQMIANNHDESQHLRDYASDDLVKDYLASLPGQVYDFRGHSPASDVQLPQHNLRNSPGSGRGNHNGMTPKVFQSPGQPKPLLAQNGAQNLAFHHLSPLPSNFVPPSQRGLNSTMKTENSSPESATAALRKVKRESQHAAGNYGSQDSGSQSSTADADDEQLINAMYNAMMDMTRHQDNPGMVKTWRSLMKETNRVKKVCANILQTCYELDRNGGPLQTAIKTQNTYDSINHRVHELCNAFKTQKTMCKHLMEAPYLHQVVDDPIQAANRVVNNRKVNRGKKQAIEAGREALKLANTGDVADDAEIEDDDADGDDDEDYGQNILQSSLSPTAGRAITASKRARPPYAPKVGSENSNDPTYDEPTTKNAKRPSNSRYQINERGEMVDLGVSPGMRHAQIAPQSHLRNRSSSARPQAAVSSGYPMAIDDRINSSHTARDESTIRLGQSGYAESGSFGDEFSGSFPNAHSGGGQQRRR